MTHQQIIHRSLDKLAERDPDIGAGLARYGYPADRTIPQGFESLAKIIIGQQISRAAATSIWDRLSQAKLTSASDIAASPLPDLQARGLSLRKAEYLQGLAQAIETGTLNLQALPHLSGSAVQAQLVALRGIGAWTADNYRLAALGDMDAWPGNDLALQEAMKRLKRLPERPTMKQMAILAEGWRPYRGAGALFLWHLYGKEVRNAAPADI